MASATWPIVDENTAIGDAAHPNYNQPSDGVDGTSGMRRFGVECRNSLQQTFTFSMVHDATSAPSVDFGIDPSLLMPAPPMIPASDALESESSLNPPMADNHRKKRPLAKRVLARPPPVQTSDIPTKRPRLEKNHTIHCNKAKPKSKQPTVELAIKFDFADPIDGVPKLVCGGTDGCGAFVSEDGASVYDHVASHIKKEYGKKCTTDHIRCVMPECCHVLQVGALKRHLESKKHFGTKYPCQRCGKELSRKDARKRHQDDLICERCTLCGAEFPRDGEASTHHEHCQAWANALDLVSQ